MVLFFKRWPLLNTMTTYCFTWSMSDIVQELVISRKDHVDWAKTVRVAATGFLFNAPLVHGWLLFLETYVPGTSTKIVIKKVVMDQIFFAPIAVSSFYLGTSLFEGRNGLPELKNKFMTTYWAGFLYWPIVQSLNFRYVPHHYKPVAVASASFLWTIFLCYMKDKHYKGEIISDAEAKGQ